ncbi:RES family NAD+ phosphorylase [Acinetobacter baumannii]|nr:RES family NAD+ phosphorylase [Acinetobacter baumannii]
MKAKPVSSICADCIEHHDEWLYEYINNNQKKYKCSICKGKLKLGIDVHDLANLFRNCLEKNYESVNGENKYDTMSEQEVFIQPGDNLACVINRIMGFELPFSHEISEILCKEDSKIDTRDGSTPFFEEYSYYIKREIDCDELDYKWNQLKSELKCERRFFSENARVFFDELFSNLDGFLATYDIPNAPTFRNLKVEKVIVELDCNSIIYRARRADFLEDCEKFITDSIQELSPPPSKFALQGRMNPKGISIFYGAFEVETCIAEVRSSIGSSIAMGEFKPSKALKILNFRSLERSYQFLSYLMPNYRELVSQQLFLHKLHKQISTPILPGHEDEYLITQVLAEYLAYVSTYGFDGIIFESTQSKGGTNIVIFPKKEHENSETIDFYDERNKETNNKYLSRFGLTFVDGSVKIFNIDAVQYSYTENIYINRNDNIYFIDSSDENFQRQEYYPII